MQDIWGYLKKGSFQKEAENRANDCNEKCKDQYNYCNFTNTNKRYVQNGGTNALVNQQINIDSAVSGITHFWCNKYLKQ